MKFKKYGRNWYKTRKAAEKDRKTGTVIYYDYGMEAYYLVKAPKKSFWSDPINNMKVPTFQEKWSDGIKEKILERPLEAFAVFGLCAFLFGILLVAGLSQALAPPKAPSDPLIVGSEYPEGTTPLYDVGSFIEEAGNIKMPFGVWVMIIVVSIIIFKVL